MCTQYTRKAAQELLKYGESRDGYYNSDKVMKHIEKAVQVVEAKFPQDEGLSTLLDLRS